MQVSVDSTEGLERKMTVELPAEQVNTAVEKRLKEIARTVKMDGFRPGKVPLSVVRKRYTGQVRDEVFGELIQSTYFQALSQEKLQPAGEPSIKPLEIDPQQGVGYVATFEVMPEITIADMSDKVITKAIATVSDADLDSMIEKLRSQRTTWNEVERAAQDGDQVTLSFKGFIDGEAFDGGSAENVPLVLGSNSMIDGFEAGLVGCKAGDKKTLELKFPDNYRVEKLAGKESTFEVEVSKVAEPVLPEVDEEFAKIFGVTEGGVEAFQKEIRSNMERELEEKISANVKQQAMDILVESNSFDVPGALIRQEAQALLQQAKANMAQSGQSSQIDLPLSLFEGQAKRRVQLGLVMGEIIKQHNIELDQDRVRAKVEQFAQSYEMPQEVVDYYYSNKQQLAGVENVVLEDQVVDWITQQVKVEEQNSTFEEVMNPKQPSDQESE
jgi:trigger factor